jgi:tetratricopeptide (TPR) repeat protein
VVVLLSSAVGVACWAWFRPARVSPPTPPEAVWNKDEPAVRAVLDAARTGVLRNPSSGEAWGYLGQVLLAHSYVDQAVSCLREAERLDPANPRWPYLLGALQGASDRKAALFFLRQALERLGASEAENFTPRLLLAEVLLSEDELGEAEQHYRYVLTAQPSNARAGYGLGLVMYRRGDLVESRRLLTACADNPYIARKACSQLAAICQRLGDQQAAETFDLKAKAPGEDHSWPDPFADEFHALAVSKRSRFARAETLQEQGRFQEAVRVLSEIAWDSEDRRALIALGIAFARMRDRRGAEKALRMGLAQAAPDDPDSYMVNGCYFLSFVLFKKGEELRARGDPQVNEVFEEAVAWARKALAYKPDYAFANVYLGLSLKQLGQRREALAAFRHAVACAPGLVDAHLHLGNALAEEGLHSEAYSELRTAARLAPANDRRAAASLARLQDEEKKRGGPESRP